MASDSVATVLNLLRQLNAARVRDGSTTFLQFVHASTGSSDELTTLKFLAAVHANLIASKDTIFNSSLDDEAKTGIVSTIQALQQGFTTSALHNQIPSILPAMDSAITNFSILVGAFSLKLPSEAIEKIDDLIKDIEILITDIDGYCLSVALKEIFLRQSRLLVSLLKNCQAIGVDGSISAYYDMIIALRKESVDDATSKTFWDRIKVWADRLDSIFSAVQIGNKLVPYIREFPRITGF